jgi:hypothetical protein
MNRLPPYSTSTTGNFCAGSVCAMLIVGFAVAVLAQMPQIARGQANLVFTVDPAPVGAAKDAAKETDAKGDDKKDAKKIGDADAAAKVNEGEVLGFRQSEVASQMGELEERMFRLAEAIRQLEPENSSRLMLGLKFAREELILHQMKDTQALLGKLNLGEAAAEQKHLLSKLQRLHDMLLSADLDLQMRLERLRELREILRRLEKAVKEEKREQQQSLEVAALEKDIEQLHARQVTLVALVKRQKGHVDTAKKLVDGEPTKNDPPTDKPAANDTTDQPAADQNATVEKVAGEKVAAAKPTDEQPADSNATAEKTNDDKNKSLAGLATDQGLTRQDAEKLSESNAQQDVTLTHVDEAVKEMAAAEKSFGAQSLGEAAAHQQNALELLESQLKDLTNELSAKESALTAEKFTALQKDQAGNREQTDAVTDLVRKLGDSGAAALGSLQAATGSMTGAEKDLGMRHAEPASGEQASAIESLNKARAQLDAELEKILDRLRADVKRRVVEDLSLMLEKQIAVRESTVVLGARVQGGGRQVLASIIALSSSENRIVNVADELLALVEETEFGIALPAALTMVRDAMVTVKDSLTAADAGEPVVAHEREIEDDLKDLLLAMRKMPSSKNAQDAADANRTRERELNRLVAELKMIRLVQVRVNRTTTQTDERRAAELQALTADLRRQIETVTNQQDDVREVTERLFSERGGEILQ